MTSDGKHHSALKRYLLSITYKFRRHHGWHRRSQVYTRVRHEDAHRQITMTMWQIDDRRIHTRAYLMYTGWPSSGRETLSHWMDQATTSCTLATESRLLPTNRSHKSHCKSHVKDIPTLLCLSYQNTRQPVSVAHSNHCTVPQNRVYLALVLYEYALILLLLILLLLCICTWNET